MDKTIKIWNCNMLKCIKTLEGHTDGVYCICYDSFNKKLFSGSVDCTVKIWDFKNQNNDKILIGHTN